MSVKLFFAEGVNPCGATKIALITLSDDIFSKQFLIGLTPTSSFLGSGARKKTNICTAMNE